jgi:hypothetical protein
MMDNIDEVTDKRLEALEAIEKDKRRVSRAYNKGNILGANQPLRENYGNFNQSHMMLIQRSA